MLYIAPNIEYVSEKVLRRIVRTRWPDIRASSGTLSARTDGIMNRDGDTEPIGSRGFDGYKRVSQ
jgi:hypothetical protein